MHRSRMLLISAACIALAFALPQASRADTQITGAGSSFDFPFFSRAFYEYRRDHGGIQINYQSIGSGGGIQQFTAKTVDFGASDVPLNAAETKAAEAANGPVLQVPVALGAEVIVYNLPDVTGHVRLSPSVLADIFLGKLTTWDDGRITALNPGVHLPHVPILVVHRADSSGTTYIFTDYLSKVSAEWKQKARTAKSVSWPAASSVGAKGNEGVAGQVRNTPGAIGYVELAYALENDISYAAIQNRNGDFVLASADTVRRAAAQRPDVSPSSFSIVDMAGRDSYPICGYSWAMLWQNQADKSKSKDLVDLFRWLVTAGQSFADQVHYVALPANVQAVAEKALAGIRS